MDMMLSTLNPAQSGGLKTSHINAIENTGDLGVRLKRLHERMLLSVPVVDRIAITLYDAKEDMLKTFINSTRVGTPIAQYQFKLSESRSLSAMAASGECRVIDDIPQAIRPASKHSQWVLDQGYRSSFTVPLYDNGSFIGIVFFDSLRPFDFTNRVQRDLLLFCSLMNMTITHELAAIRSIVGSTQMARDFANLRDFETGSHVERVARVARLIAQGVAAKHQLSDEFIEHVYLFAPLHDIGKIGIPDSVLLKPGKLDPAERARMQAHVVKGAEIVEKIISDFGLQDVPDAQILANIVLSHHECMDGSGYPYGLKGEAVPIEARIVAVADIFDALVNRRVYKEPWPPADACRELAALAADGKLDADCVAVICGGCEAFMEIVRRYGETPELVH